ncbi:2'-5' RNA ligase family protein [Embleya sp. MST-111070]|uniref:2'-5' RNA ligase family protein n=1 Tax=Embleya sp. MST-111070 TaxID=3398231 RepID=UPI003F73C23D
MTTSLRSDPTTFPVDPPPSLLDAKVIAEHDWGAFRAVSTMVDHWDRPGWNGGRAYYWMLTFAHEEALIHEALTCQAVVADPFLDPVPSEGLHITLNKVADAADTNPVFLAQLVDRVRGQTPDTFELSVGPLAGSQGSLRYSVAPWGPVIDLHAVLAGAGAPAGGPTALLRPHLGIAYSNRARPAAEVIEQVALLRGRPRVAVRVDGVDLVELRRERAAYRWDVVARVPLCGT